MSFRPSKHYGQAPKLKPSLLSDTEPLFKGAKNSSRFTATFPAVNRPMKDALKPKATISVSGVFNRKPMKEVYPQRPGYTRRPRAPEHQLFINYKMEMDASRQSITDAATDALDTVNAELNASLDKIKLRDAAFLEEIERQRDSLLTPLVEDRVRTNFVKENGEKSTKIVNVGELCLELKRRVKERETELATLWAEWDSVQQEIIGLGAEVLEMAADSKYAKKMNSLNLDLKNRIAEVQAQIEASGIEATKAMEASEKNFEIEIRKFKAELVQQILDETV